MGTTLVRVIQQEADDTPSQHVACKPLLTLKLQKYKMPVGILMFRMFIARMLVNTFTCVSYRSVYPTFRFILFQLVLSYEWSLQNWVTVCHPPKKWLSILNNSHKRRVWPDMKCHLRVLLEYFDMQYSQLRHQGSHVICPKILLFFQCHW